MISVRNLVFEVQSSPDKIVRILDGISLDIHEGEAITIMGPNGSGKSTFVRCLNALLEPTTGEILVDNLSTTQADNHVTIKTRIGMVFQNPENQIVSTSVEREIAFGLENIGMPRKQMQEVVNKMLSKFRLDQYRYHPPHLLSGGEKQRLAIAAIMAMKPKYLILDEPTSFLDSIGKQDVLTMLKRIHHENREHAKSERITTILITQYPEEALGRERLLIMKKGKIIADARPESIFRRIQMLKEIGLDVPVEFEFENEIREKFKLDSIALMAQYDV
ncbi:ATP-binding cassette domain-containing protein [candidate division KSB1 bacterium]|nr:ATP-binding cassette domain-containing protein [candidate division KSB1 bacterium]